MGTLPQDLRFGFRLLKQRPLLTIAISLSLALGIVDVREQWDRHLSLPRPFSSSDGNRDGRLLYSGLQGDEG